MNWWANIKRISQISYLTPVRSRRAKKVLSIHPSPSRKALAKKKFKTELNNKKKKFKKKTKTEKYEKQKELQRSQPQNPRIHGWPEESVTVMMMQRRSVLENHWVDREQGILTRFLLLNNLVGKIAIPIQNYLRRWPKVYLPKFTKDPTKDMRRIPASWRIKERCSILLRILIIERACPTFLHSLQKISLVTREK